MWLDAAASAPPLTVELTTEMQQAMQAALTEQCDVPKTSALGAASAMTALVLALGTIALGSVYAKVAPAAELIAGIR